MRLTERAVDTAARFLALREASDRFRAVRSALAHRLSEQAVARARLRREAREEIRAEARRLLAEATERLRARWLTRSNSAATNAP